MRIPPLTLVPLLLCPAYASVSLAAQQQSSAKSTPITARTAAASPSQTPHPEADRKSAKQAADEKPSILLMGNALLAANQQPCYTIRSYSYSPTDPDTGSVTPTGVSTCQPGRSFHRKDATVPGRKPTLVLIAPTHAEPQ